MLGRTWARKAGWTLGAVGLIGLFAAGCSSQAPSAPAGGDAGTKSAAPGGESGSGAAPAAKKPDIQLKVPETIPQSQPTPATGAAAPKAASPVAGTSPAPAPKTAASPVAAAQRTPPKGKATWAWHTALSPQWLDPQEYPAGTFTPFIFGYFVHDAMVKHLPGQPYAPSLAESYEIAPDFKSATFKLRPNLKFQNGDPVTSADVKWTFENYRGGNAKAIKDKVASIETPDDRTTKFTFKEPFLDFMVYYGGGASSIGWIVPSKYYQQVGPDAFKQKPIGAGPFKVVRHQAGSEIEMEAFTDYWRKNPGVQTFVIKGVPEAATRSAMMQAGEADFNTLIPGQLWELVTKDPNQTPAPTRASAIFIEFTDWQKPDSPFNKMQVRQAVSLALDRKAISDAEEAGLSQLDGNWIPQNFPDAIELPKPEENLAKAKQLMAEAGYPNGFEVSQITPFPPYNSLAERVISAMRELGIRTRLNTMERAAYSQKLSEGPGAIEGILVHVSASPGDAASWIRAWATCKGSSSRMCIQAEIEDKLAAYDKSTNPAERKKLIEEMQRYLVDNYIFVQIYRQAVLNAQGPRIANKPDEIWGAVPLHPLVAPTEDVRVKE